MARPKNVGDARTVRVTLQIAITTAQRLDRIRALKKDGMKNRQQVIYRLLDDFLGELEADLGTVRRTA